MSYTERELVKIVAQNMDITELLDLLDISIEELAEKFGGKILENESTILDYLDHSDDVEA